MDILNHTYFGIICKYNILLDYGNKSINSNTGILFFLGINNLKLFLDIVVWYRVYNEGIKKGTGVSMEDELTRGKAAKEAGVNIETLRYYENIGVIPKPFRSESGYRIYTGETVQRIRFVKVMQKLGFTLQEIKELLDIKMNSKTACRETTHILHQKINDVKDKISSLQRILETLESMELTCSMNKTKEGCPVLESLNTED